MSHMSYKKKRLLCIAIIIVLLVIIVIWISPIVFARDGVLTRKKVESYQAQFDLGATSRHDSEITDIYLFYMGFKTVSVQTEKTLEGYDVEVRRIMPFLYKWERNPEDSVFRVNIGENKYYYTMVSN